MTCNKVGTYYYYYVLLVCKNVTNEKYKANNYANDIMAPLTNGRCGHACND